MSTNICKLFCEDFDICTIDDPRLCQYYENMMEELVREIKAYWGEEQE